jgi:hypothetical protein
MPRAEIAARAMMIRYHSGHIANDQNPFGEDVFFLWHLW